MGCTQNAKLNGKNINGQLMTLLNQQQNFQPPIGQIKDQYQLKDSKLFLKFQNELSGLRNIREDQNQFYNIVFYNYFSFLCEAKETQKFQELITLCDNLEWILIFKKKPFPQSPNEMKQQFKQFLKKSFENNLFEFYYSNVESNQCFYALSMIFMRNWVFDIKQQSSPFFTKIQQSKILDWGSDYDLSDIELIQQINKSINMEICILDADSQDQKKQNQQKNQIIIVKQQSQLYYGLPRSHFQGLVPSQMIYDLYKETCLARQVAQEYTNFVGQTFPKEFLIAEFCLSNEMYTQIGLKGFKRVRGDGNCFYNTIIFQYLKFIICEFSDADFIKFLQILNKMKFFIEHPTIKNYNEQLQNFHKTIFKSTLYEIRGWQNKAEKFESEFSNTNNIFYALSIIYIKNLCYYLVEQKEDYITFLGQEAQSQIRQWEFETDNIQVLLVVLQEQLKVNLHLYLIDSDRMDVEKQIYFNQSQSEEKKCNIFLIYNPGHYCIGLNEI